MKKRLARSIHSLKKAHHNLKDAFYNIAQKATSSKLREWPSTGLTLIKPITTEELLYIWQRLRAK
jgi:hypothetical protein